MEAVERARGSAADADLRVLVVDVSAEFPTELAVDGDTIVVLNKSDLESRMAPERRAGLERQASAVLLASARTGDGCATLAETLVAEARRRLEAQPVGISRLRHRAALERTLEALARAQDLAGSEDSCELAALELRTALTELAAISQPSDNEDVLDLIFSEFCIGK
jgi:tRNA modification GTPase